MTKTVTDYQIELNDAIEQRKLYEVAKNAANDSIVACLNNISKSVAHADIANVLMLNNVDANFINSSERVSNRFNVYAAEKVANAARAAASVATLNHYTQAILKTALALEAAQFALTHKSASAACSASVKHNDAKIERIVKTTRYAKHIAANTASTQSSSSINALKVMNVLSEVRNAANEIAFIVNRESLACIALAAKLNVSLEVAVSEVEA